MKQFKYFIALAVGLMVTACSSSEDYKAEKNPHAGEVMQFVANINSPIIGTKAVQNSANLQDNGFADGEKVGVYITSGSNNLTGTPFTNALIYNKTNGYFEWESTPVKFPDFGAVSVQAIYPMKDCKDVSALTFIDTGSFTVSTDQSTDAGYKISDLMFASINNVSSNPVPLTFRHCLTKIVVNITGLQDTNPAVWIQAFTSGTTRPGSNGSLEITGTPSNNQTITIGNSTASTLTGIIIPQTITKGSNFIILYKNGQSPAFQPSEDLVLLGGHEYTFNLTFSKENVLQSSTVTVTPWDDTTEAGGATSHSINGTIKDI